MNVSYQPVIRLISLPDPVDDAGLQQLEDVVVEERGELRVLLQCNRLIELYRVIHLFLYQYLLMLTC